MRQQAEEIEDRIVTIDRLKKKYGGTVDAVLDHLSRIQDEHERLSDFESNVEKLTRAKHDRLVRDPEPIRLLGNRNLDDIRTMTAKRLAYLYDSAGDDSFVGTPTSSNLKAANNTYSNTVFGFAHVNAFSSTGNDLAALFDGAYTPA